MKRLALVVVAVALMASLLSCSGSPHKQWRDASTWKEDAASYSLRFIEADDEGWFWNPTHAKQTLELVRDKARDGKTLVVVFVHGWHHSAQCCDQNVEGFRSMLRQLRSLTGEFDIVGIYLGWRGRSLPGFLDYFTFWGRKGAAERVGQTDMKEFLARLHALYTEARPDVCAQQAQIKCPPPQEPADTERFLGLVTLGHSFGAQVLLRAVSGSLEDQLQHLNPQPAFLRDAEPAQAAAPLEHNLAGIGDLMVLINPAAEAAQYHRLHILSRGLNYSSRQSPVMLVVSAENDWARHKLFTFGRWLGEIFTGKPYKHNEVERGVERQALGVYAGHVTHQLRPVDDTVTLANMQVERATDGCNCAESTVEWLKWSQAPQSSQPNSLDWNDPARDAQLRDFDFSGKVVFNGVALAPLDETAGAGTDSLAARAPPQPYQPLIVATTSRHVINQHSGIFTDPFLHFLVPYIVYIEEKSRINMQENRNQREEMQKTLQAY